MDRVIDASATGAAWTFAVEAADGGLIGTTRIELQSARRRCGELSYWIAPAYRGLGYGTMAVRMTCEVAGGQLGLVELEAFVKESNAASRKVLINCGFQKESINSRMEGELVWRFTRRLHAGEENKMRIRAEQRESLRQEAAAPTVERLAAEMRCEYPDRCEGMSDQDVLDHTYDAVSSAWDYGLHRDYQVHAFVKLRFTVGHYFDEYGRFQQILDSEIDPDLKLDLLLQNASPSDWRTAARMGPQDDGL